MTSANLLSLPTLATISTGSANAVQGPADREGMFDITILPMHARVTSPHRWHVRSFCHTLSRSDLLH